MVAEIYGGISAFKAMFDLAKTVKDINDTAIRQTASIELLEKILTAREAQAAALERIRELEEEIAKFETWDTEKENYELQAIARGATAYMLKPDARGSKPPHWLCAQCFENRKRSILQLAADFSVHWVYHCQGCGSKICVPSLTSPSWQ